MPKSLSWLDDPRKISDLTVGEYNRMRLAADERSREALRGLMGTKELLNFLGVSRVMWAQIKRDNPGIVAYASVPLPHSKRKKWDPLLVVAYLRR